MSPNRCHSCGGLDCPAAGKDYVDDCPLWQEAEARAARGEYLTTTPYDLPGQMHGAQGDPAMPKLRSPVSSSEDGS